jgi:hypothetical protein
MPSKKLWWRKTMTRTGHSHFLYGHANEGKEFDYARLRAKEKGIRFVRSRFGRIQAREKGLEIKYVSEDGKHLKEAFDMLVLPEGLESPEDAGLSKSHSNRPGPL